MRHAVEHRGLDHRIVNHILEHDAIADPQVAVEDPIPVVIPGQTTVAAHTPTLLSRFRIAGPQDRRFIGHLQAVGHVAGERHVEHRRTHAAVLNDVLHGRNQVTRPPSEGAAGLQDDAEPGIAGVETAEQGHQRIDVVVGTGHEVAAAKIDPLDLGKPFGKMVFYMYERAREDVGAALAMAMAMEARCYRGGEGRTKMKPLHYQKRDRMAYLTLLVYLAAVIGLRILWINVLSGMAAGILPGAFPL